MRARARTAQERESAKAAAARAVSDPLPPGVREGRESPRSTFGAGNGVGLFALECS